jgi:amidase
MQTSNLHYLSVVELAALIRKRELSPVDVVQAQLDRIEAIDPNLHAYARVFPEFALEQARAAEAAVCAGRPLGPLHGVPIGIKDLLWVAGHPTAFGTTVHAEFVPSQDATVVRRLKEAGAIILGKLQMTEGAFALHHTTIPTPLNPWGANHWSGASSSGPGVATAAGLCYASVGSDTGGSIRFPSTANALTGIKPTWGRVSRHGAFELAASLDHIGPMARDAQDATLLLGVMAGHDPLDPTTLPDATLELPVDAHDFKGIRVGVDPRWNSNGTDPVICEGIDRVLLVTRDLRGSLREVRFPEGALDVAKDWEANAGIEAARAHLGTYPRLASEYGPALSRLIDIGRAASGLDYQGVLLRRAGFRGRLDKLLSEVDLVVLPVQPFAAPTYEQLGALADDPDANSRLIQYTAPINATGHPSITLPCGFTAEGLPIGFQLVAAHGGEAMLCRAGMAYQHATDWHRRHPTLHS